jgi:hypothetical protein
MTSPKHVVPIGAAALLLVAPLFLHAQSRLPDDSLAIGRRYATWFLTSQIDSLTANMSAGTLTALGGRDGLTQRMAEIAARAGQVTGVVEERFVWRNGQRQYWRVVNTTGVSEPVAIRIVISPKGEMIGFGANPLSSVPPIDSGGPPIRKPE